MPGKTDKRKKVEQDSGDEMQLGRQNKFRRTGYVTSGAIFGCPVMCFCNDILALIAKNIC